MEVTYPVCTFLQKLTLRTFADWQVTGRENVPPMGPLIIVANHQSNLDPPLLAPSLPRRVKFLAKQGIFRGPLVSWFLRSWGAFPLNRDAADISAFRWVLSELERDQAIVLFPEGTRSRGGMRKAHLGVARLALKSQAPLLPVGITGTEKLGTVLRAFNPTGKLRVNIGTVFSLPGVEGRLEKEVLDSLTDMIMRRVAALLPPRYQGVYSVTGQVGAAVTANAGKGVENGDRPLA